MPLKRFQILNKGIIKHAECDQVPCVMIIAGPNGVGKSTLLEILKRNIPLSREGDVKVEATGTPLYVPPHRLPISFELHRLYPVMTSRKFRETLKADNFPGFPSYWGGIPHYLSSGTSRTKNLPDFSSSDIKRRLAEIDIEFNRVLRSVYDKRGEIPPNVLPSDIYKPFRDFVERFLHLKFESVKLEGDYYKIYFVNRLGAKVEFNELSSGEKDIVATLFPFTEKKIENELARAREETPPSEDIIVLIDGPDEYLHPSLQRSFLEYMREQVSEAEKRGEKLQFIITTHSPTLVNEAGFEELFIMLFPDQVAGMNQLVTISTDKEKLRIVRNLLGEISPLATGKPVLLLEGPTDVNVLRLLVSNIEKDFTLLPLSGIKEIESFIGNFEKVIPELKLRGFVIHAILDGHHREVEIKFDVIHIWPVACIENFLLFDEEAIYEAIKTLIGPVDLENRGIRSKEDIKKLICEIIKDHSLKEKECEKRLSRDLHGKYNLELPLTENIKQKVQSSLEKRVERVRRRLEETQQELERLVQDLDKARREFDGKLIIGELGRRFSVKREELSYLIASKINELDRVPIEVSELLDHIRKLSQ